MFYQHPSSSSRHSSSSSSSHTSRRPLHKQRERSEVHHSALLHFISPFSVGTVVDVVMELVSVPLQGQTNLKHLKVEKCMVHIVLVWVKQECMIWKAILQKYMNKRRIFNRERSGSSVERSGIVIMKLLLSVIVNIAVHHHVKVLLTLQLHHKNKNKEICQYHENSMQYETYNKHKQVSSPHKSSTSTHTLHHHPLVISSP